MEYFGLHKESAKQRPAAEHGMTDEQFNKAMKAALVARIGATDTVVHRTVKRSELDRS